MSTWIQEHGNVPVNLDDSSAPAKNLNLIRFDQARAFTMIDKAFLLTSSFEIRKLLDFDRMAD